MNYFVFYTIITESHLPWALALNHSLKKFNDSVKMCIFVVDKENIDNDYLKYFPNTKILYKKDIQYLDITQKIFEKYSKDKDALRWSLKPVVGIHLLQEYYKVFHCDSDIYFYNDYNFLIDYLNEYQFLLSPHWRSSDPHQDRPHFDVLYTHGIFNGGFFGCNQSGKAILKWWADLCYFKCEKDVAKGFYVDQKYLDIVPAYYEGVKIIRHLGCNVSEWNTVICKRVRKENGDVLIRGKYPIIFIHYANKTIKNIIYDGDLDIKYLKELDSALIKFGLPYSIIEKTKEKYNLKLNDLNRRTGLFMRFKKLIS